MLRERRLAAMRAEIEQSLDAPPPEIQPGRGYDPNRLLLGGNADAELWTNTGTVPSTELATADPPYTSPMSAPTMNVAMGGWPTGVWPRPGPPLPFPPDAWQPWKRHSIEGLQGLIGAWRRLFRRSAEDSQYDPDCDKEWEEAREFCKEELAKPNPSRGMTGGYGDVENCARGHVSQRCGGNRYDDTPRRRK
jgi:hypothetical protein